MSLKFQIKNNWLFNQSPYLKQNHIFQMEPQYTEKSTQTNSKPEQKQQLQWIKIEDVKRRDKLQCQLILVNSVFVGFFLLCFYGFYKYIFLQVYQQLRPLTDIEQDFMGRSSIIKSKKDVAILNGFFDKKLSQAVLLYKASQHDFKMSEYFRLCGKFYDTMIVIKTDKQKIIGGYSVLSHEISQEDIEDVPIRYRQIFRASLKQDNSMKSFLFSLTNNEKFVMRAAYLGSIARIKNKDGIQFGNREELTLYSSNNICKGGVSFINWDDRGKNGSKQQSSYYNKNYTGGSGYRDQPNFQFVQQDMIRFHGQCGVFFNIQEWEVWKVFLNQNDLSKGQF